MYSCGTGRPPRERIKAARKNLQAGRVGVALFSVERPLEDFTETAMQLLDFAKEHNFEPIQPAEWHRHLPPSVAAGLPLQDTAVFSVSDEHSDTAQFSERYRFSLEDCANTLVLRYSRDGLEHHAAVINLGSRRLDVNGAVKARLGAKRISFAKREVATELTAMEFGGITAFGLPKDMKILVDEEVMRRKFVVMGAGYRRTKILLDPNLLSALDNVEVAPLTVQEP
jgi:prolyl-tRNA editing enzyme YbaK/EbsC (Cys-tRNA(Pro) deacylase)